MSYKRILLKLSGEALGGEKGVGLNESTMTVFAKEISEIAKNGVQVAIVIGGGNIFRGIAGTEKGFDRVRGDQMGMLATVINSIGLSVFIKEAGVDAEVYTATPMMPMAKYYMRDEVVDYLNRGGVAIIAGGTGNPYCTTDSAAALRACEIKADALLKGTKVDGVYDSDPMKNPSAKKYKELSFAKAIADDLHVMDQTAFTMCKENDMPIVVFNMNKRGELAKIVSGEPVGTIVSNK